MSERHFTLRVDGHAYHQDFLPAAKALRLYHKVARLGMRPLGDVAAKYLSGDLDTSDRGQVANEIAGAVYELLQTTEPEDIDWILATLSEHTWIETSGDGASATLRLDAAPKHFADARDVFRLLEFLTLSIVEQMRPFANGLTTRFGRRPLDMASNPRPA